VSEEEYLRHVKMRADEYRQALRDDEMPQAERKRRWDDWNACKLMLSPILISALIDKHLGEEQALEDEG